MAQEGNDIAPSTRGNTCSSGNAPVRAATLLSRVSGLFKQKRKLLTSTSARASREEPHRGAPERKEVSAPVAPFPRGDRAELSHPQELLERPLDSQLGQERVVVDAEASATETGPRFESAESPMYRTRARIRRALPTGGTGTGVPPSVDQTAPSRLWAGPPAGDAGPSTRMEREGGIPIGTIPTTYEVARRLSFSGEEPRSPGFAPRGDQQAPTRNSFLSSTHTGDAPERLHLELEDEEEATPGISRTMVLPHVEERGPIAPLSTHVDERAGPRPRSEGRIPVRHRQVSSDSS